MQKVNLTVEVHCYRPQWGIINPIDKFTDSRYRIYVNDDMIVERSWLWDNHIFLLEDIWVNLLKNTNNIFKVEPVLYISQQANFHIENFNVLGYQTITNKINDLEINFILR